MFDFDVTTNNKKWNDMFLHLLQQTKKANEPIHNVKLNINVTVYHGIHG